MCLIQSLRTDHGGFAQVLLTEAELKEVANDSRGQRTASTILKEEMAGVVPGSPFDVFLSHSFKDAEIVLGVKRIFEKLGFTAYVDWIEDSQLDRTEVTSATAELLRKRMRQSKPLIYMHSNNSPGSRWMPWELGYFDGFRSAVAVLPVAKSSSETFSGQEFLGLYPYIDGAAPTSLFINKGTAPRSRIGSGGATTDLRFVKSWLKEFVVTN